MLLSCLFRAERWLKTRYGQVCSCMHAEFERSTGCPGSTLPCSFWGGASVTLHYLVHQVPPHPLGNLQVSLRCACRRVQTGEMGPTASSCIDGPTGVCPSAEPHEGTSCCSIVSYTCYLLLHHHLNDSTWASSRAGGPAECTHQQCHIKVTMLQRIRLHLQYLLLHCHEIMLVGLILHMPFNWHDKWDRMCIVPSK